MPYEIERKFLVRGESWRRSAEKAASVRQAYLARSGSMSLRVRIEDEVRATLTIKSSASNVRRLEFEYEIPLADAVALLDLREGGIVEKLRYRLPQDGLTWEIDVFQGENEGLVIAEIELPHEDEAFERPDWLGREVTEDPRYSNVSLAAVAFQTWPHAGNPDLP
jgi:adenylate cyclase